MNYIKIFRELPVDSAEKVINAYFENIHEVGHRVIHAKYEFGETPGGFKYLSAVITLSDAPSLRSGPASVISKQL